MVSPSPDPNPNPNPNAPGGERIHHVGAAVVTQGAAWPETQAKSVKSEEPAAKHVPSMPQRKPSLDVRLQESVKSEEGGAPAAAAPLAEGQGFLKRASTLFGLLGESEAKSE